MVGEGLDIERFRSIDMLRGMAIILMIQVHFVDNLSPYDPSSWLYQVSIFLGSFPAPFFTFVSGLSYGLWLRKQQTLRRADEEITKATLHRAAFLFAVGIALNFFAWLPEGTFNWDILTLLGTSFLILAYARKLPIPVLTLICVMVLLVSPLLRVVGDFNTYWEDDAYVYDFTLEDIVFGFFSNGYFPVFPWVIFPITGFISRDLVFHRRGPAQSTPWWLCTLGIALAALGLVAAALGAWLPAEIALPYADGLTEFPASTDYVFAMLGSILFSLVLLHHWIDRVADGTGDGRLITIINRFSVFSLTVYVVHHFVILSPLWIYGAWTGQEDVTIYWRNAMTAPLALASAVVFVIACHFGLLVLEKHRKTSLESLMRWICD